MADDERTNGQAEAAGVELPEYRELVYLDAKQLTFSRTPGGVLRMQMGDARYDEVRVYATRPLSAPDTHLSLRDAKDEEIGLLRDLDHLEPKQRALVLQDLERRYFRPIILRVKSVSMGSGTLTWEVETDRGDTTFTSQSARYSVRSLTEGRWLVTDQANNRFELRNVERMDRRSQRLLNDLLS